MSSAPSPPAGADVVRLERPPPSRSPDDVETADTFRADVARIVAAGETDGWEAATRLAEQEREQT